MANRMTVTCYNVNDARGFAFWSRPEDFVGKDGVLISFDDCPWEPQIFNEYFTRIELVEEFWMTRNGKPLNSIRIFLCTNQVKPFPVSHFEVKKPKPPE